jgi:ATP-dependent Clp protease ATP-binding subunit ClpC
MNDLMDDDDKMMSKKTKSSDSSTPVLDNFSRDLNKLAEAGKLDPVVGREREILRIAQILSRRKKNNPINTNKMLFRPNDTPLLPAWLYA